MARSPRHPARRSGLLGRRRGRRRIVCVPRMTARSWESAPCSLTIRNSTCALSRRTAAVQPRRIVLDSAARTPLDARLWKSADAGPLLIACGSDAPIDRIDALRAHGATVLLCARNAAGRISIDELLRQLPKHGVLSVLVEGGAAVLGALFDSGIADKVHIFVAPKIMGGAKSLSALGGMGAAAISDVRTLANVSSQRCGEDVLFEGALSQWGRVVSFRVHARSLKFSAPESTRARTRFHVPPRQPAPRRARHHY